MTRAAPVATPTPSDRVKRIVDVAGAAVLLVLTAPVAGVAALAIRIDSPGPVLLRQCRVGRGGRPFVCFKFRTMAADADDSAHREYMARLIAGSADAGHHPRTGEPVYRLVDDPRITRVGRVLRRTSIDELPQLWNVLRGDMSLVGPRPPLPFEVEHYRSEHLERLAVRPGITGLWQATAWDRATFDEMVALDRRYIRERSLGLDLRILVRTVTSVPRRLATR